MSKYCKYFLEILSHLNNKETDAVASLLHTMQLKYEYRGTDLHIKDEKAGKHFNIVFFYNSIIGKYQFLTPHNKKNLFNCDPHALVAYAVSSKSSSKITVPSTKCSTKIKKRIIVYTDDPVVADSIEKSKEIYNFKAHVMKTDGMQKSVMELYDRGYRFFILGAVITTDFVQWIRDHPDAKFIMPIVSNTVVSTGNLLKMNCSDEYMMSALAKMIAIPTLVVSEDNAHALHRSKLLMDYLPNSKLIMASDPNVSNIIDKAEQTAVFFSVNTEQGIKQLFSNCRVTNPSKIFWASNELQQYNISFNHIINSITIHYPNTDRNSKLFKHMTMEDYLFIDAIYHMSNYIKTGISHIAGITGVCEYDSYGNRLWYSFLKMMRINENWIQNYITEIPPNA